MKIKTKTVSIISLEDFDHVVQETYGKPYSFQQQDGCRERGSVHVSVPYFNGPEDFENDTIIESINSDEMGVSLKGWLARDPEEPLADEPDPEKANTSFYKMMFWHRHFYPSLGILLEDLHERGIIDEGEYYIEIDW